MTTTNDTTGESVAAAGVFRKLWKAKSWWLLPLIVLFLLIGAAYVLGHLSAADPETYRTTYLIGSSFTPLC